MRIGLFNEMVEDTFLHTMVQAILAVGKSGIGKTQAPKDFTKRHDWGLEAICMPLVNPTYLMGYPFQRDGMADHAPFGALSRALHSTRPTVLVLDDLGGASGETCKAGLRLIQDREVCGKRFPDHVKIIALTNDVGQGMEIQGMVEPMKDRFISIVNVEEHIDDTVVYGLSRGWSPTLLAYLKNDTEALHDMVPMKSMQRSGATPRGWEGVADLERAGFLEKPYGDELCWGAVGRGRGTAYMAYRKLANDLPHIDTILLDPKGAPVPKEPSAVWLVSMTLASRMNADTFGRILVYLNRLPQMFRAYSIQGAIKAENALRAAKKLPEKFKPLYLAGDFAAWSATEEGKLISGASVRA
jgi:hypothetical protein